MTRAPVTLLLTNSLDFVADQIVTHLGGEHLFRFNSDLWREYRVRFTGESIELENAAGLRISDADIAKVYRRSSSRAPDLYPHRAFTTEERFMEEEIWSAWNDVVNIFWAAGKVVLIQPYAAVRMGKLQQLRVAAKYFRTTPHSFLINRPDALRRGVESVAKSFSFRFGPDTGFYSRKVREEQLDPTCAWFITDLIAAEEDVTVAVVRDELFAFALDRRSFVNETIDWRQSPAEHRQQQWKPVTLPPRIVEGIFAFMNEAGAHYARLDFLRSGDDYVFLECNFTGEWGWLDLEGRHGLRDKILREIDPRTPCVGCPRLSLSR